MKRILSVAAIALTAVVVVATDASARPGDPHHRHPRPAPAGQAPVLAPPANGRGFTLDCTLSHSASVDPIVMPGMAGMSHLHEFFGNTGTDEDSTGASLLREGTTCNDARNHSSYWVPALYQDGAYVAPAAMKVRYNVGPANTRTSAYPLGFKAVSGRTNDTAAWGCVTPGAKPAWSGDVGTVPTCTGASHLVAQVTFGACWDGVGLDSGNHMSHLVLPTNGRCPADHRTRVPQVRLTVDYPKAATGGAGVTLASGAASTLHGDIFEAWEPGALEARIRAGR